MTFGWLLPQMQRPAANQKSFPGPKKSFTGLLSAGAICYRVQLWGWLLGQAQRHGRWKCAAGQKSGRVALSGWLRTSIPHVVGGWACPSRRPEKWTCSSARLAAWVQMRSEINAFGWLLTEMQPVLNAIGWLIITMQTVLNAVGWLITETQPMLNGL